MDNYTLSKYMNNSINDILFKALRSINIKDIIFIIKSILNAKRAYKKRLYFEKYGKHIPSFLIASITNNCNLSCEGCYAKEQNLKNKTLLSKEEWKKIFEEAKNIGVSFCLLAGGETLMRKDVIKEASKIKEIIFPVFTNGTLIDNEYMNIFKLNKNLIPILSLEGNKNYTDKRRGINVYESVIKVMENLKKEKIFYGTSITVTKENMKEVTSESFINLLNEKKCKIVFYVEYVPVDKNTIHLTFGETERKTFENTKNYIQKKYKNIIFVSFPGDEKYMGGCLASGRGFFHINSFGDAESCPFSPYSDINLKENTILEVIDSKLFKNIKENNLNSENHLGGCALFENEEKVKKLLDI